MDHVFFCNPTNQTVSIPPAVLSWTNLVIREIMQRVIDTLGTRDFKELFAAFDQDGSGFVTREEFDRALFFFGFRGDGTAALTAEEIAELIATADVNGDGIIDYIEFCDRCKQAFESMPQPEIRTFNESKAAAASNLEVMRKAMKRSRWLTRDLSRESLENMNDDDFWFDHRKESAAESVAVPLTPSDKISKPMGDLEVLNTSIYPKVLENGIWPNDYQLSDHGIVEVLFKVNIHK